MSRIRLEFDAEELAQFSPLQREAVLRLVQQGEQNLRPIQVSRPQEPDNRGIIPGDPIRVVSTRSDDAARNYQDRQNGRGGLRLPATLKLPEQR